ncbi:30S ribosomal protein S20 [bacterium]|nr:30S ribosomal protein S20 [bacterium]
MPQHKSCEKRMRTSARERAHNRHYRNVMKKAIRRVENASTAEEGRAALREAVSMLDRLAGKGIIHRNRAASRKSRLHRRIARLEEAAQ